MRRPFSIDPCGERAHLMRIPLFRNARIQPRLVLSSPDLKKIVLRSTAEQRCRVNDAGPASESDCVGS